MRLKVVESLFMFVALVDAYSQADAFYPLHHGNLWQYVRFFGQWPDLVSMRVIGDTLMPNGKSYVVLRQWDEYSQWFYYQRASADSVLEFDPSTQQEYLLYQFLRSEGDTISVVPRPWDTLFVVLTDTQSVFLFGSPHQSWTFSYDFVPSIDDEFSRTLADSIGVTSESSAWLSMNLQGAIINGRQYGTIVAADDERQLPQSYQLHQSYPNPFNATTVIKFEIPKPARVSLRVFDVLGREIATLADGEKIPGVFAVPWNAAEFASGTYLYRLQSGDFVETRKMVLVK